MSIPTSVSTYLVMSIMVLSVLWALRENQHNLRFPLEVFRRFRLKLFFQTSCVVFGFLGLIGMTYAYIPFLQYSWLCLLFEDGNNMMGRGLSQGLNSPNLSVSLLSIMFLLILLFFMPFIIKAMEEDFRRGCATWKGILWQSTKSGLIFCLIGAPLVVGVGLGVASLFYGQKYKSTFEHRLGSIKDPGLADVAAAEDEAIMASTTAHTMFYSILVLVLLLITVF